jgi:acetylornithine deacetylase/succinyl-diaminopimelate desuccinylase family protein
MVVKGYSNKNIDIAESIDEKELLGLCRALIRIPSVFREEERIAKFIASRLDKWGLPPEVLPVEGCGPCVVARIGPENRPSIVMNGHMDTVEVKDGWRHDPFSAKVEKGMLYGLGSLDMKCGLASLMLAFRTIAQANLRLDRSIVFQAVSDEEENGAGTMALISAGKFRKAKAVIVGEGIGSLDVVTIGRRGGSYYDIWVSGKSVHGSTPHLGVNALSDAAKIVTAVDRMEMRSARGVMADNITPLKESQLVLEISGNSASYSVPDKCHIRIMRATVPGKPYDIRTEIESTIKKLNLESSVKVQLKVGNGDPYLPHMTPASNELVNVTRKWNKYYTGREPSLVCGLSEADDNTIAKEVGVPVVCVGPGEKGKLARYHQPEEAISVSQLGIAARIHCSAVLELAGTK